MYQAIGLPASRRYCQQLLGENLEQRFAVVGVTGIFTLGAIIPQPRALTRRLPEMRPTFPALPQQLCVSAHLSILR